MLLRAGVEDQFVSRDAGVAHRARHVVRRAVDDEVAEEGLALPEGAVEGFARVQLVEAVEKVLLGVGEELLQVRGGGFGGQLALVAEVEAFVAVAVDEERGFGEVAALPFVAWEVADQVAVYGGAVVEVSVAVDAQRLGVVGVEVRLLGCGLQG